MNQKSLIRSFLGPKGSRTYSKIKNFKPQVFGTLVETDDMPVIRPADGVAKYSPSSSRFDERTLKARSPAPGMVYLPEALSKSIGSISYDWDPQELRQEASKLFKAFQEGESHRPAFENVEADAQIMGTFLQTYSSLVNVLSETKARMPDNWLPKKVLDIGFGPATGILALNEIFENSNDIERKVAVIFGNARMTRRAHQLLDAQRENGANSTIMRHHVPPPASTARFDLIIASHQLYQAGANSQEVADSHARRLATLLAPGGVLVLVERGDPYGFESIARARQVIIRPEDNSDISRSYVPLKGPSDGASLGMKVLAPCSHHGKCPLQAGLRSRQVSKNAGTMNWCRFSQNVHRPKYTLELKKGKYLAQPWLQSDKEYGKGAGGKSLAGKGRPFGVSNEEASHSYLVIKASEQQVSPRPFSKANTEATLETVYPPTTGPVAAAEADEALPRILKNPLKRDGHVIMEVCAPSANIEQWTVTRSQGKTAYHDARKSSGGDLWALGAKVVQHRGGLKVKDVEAASKAAAKVVQKEEAGDHWVNETPDGSNSFIESLSMLEEIDEQRGEKLKRKDRQETFQKWN